MPELRQNVATREWVVIATERAKRPEDFADPKRAPTSSRPERVATCPFCPGNEAMTPPALLTVDSGGAWAIRVFENKFPALSTAASIQRTLHGIERRMTGFGIHEVIVESPRHNVTMALQTDASVAQTLATLRRRGEEAAKDERVQLTIYFKNHGAAAGTSLEHPHCQMISVPVVPYAVRTRLQDALAYFDEHGSCVFCDMWRQELSAGARVVIEGRHFVSFLPFAAYSPFHLWVVPKRHMPLYTQIDDIETEDLATVLRGTLSRLYHGLGDPDFNFVIRTAPTREGQAYSFHWYVSIVPKVTKSAGFELGSGMFINTSLPEESARFLREVKAP